jgi:hypothetical protein
MSLDDLAAEAIDAVDERTLQRMRDLYETLDPVPAGLVDRVQFGITLEALHAEIAELQRSDELVGVRGEEATATQTITFTSVALTAMVTIGIQSADRVRLDGWVAPGDGVSVELRIGTDVLRTVCDADGRFVFAEVPRGLAQFVLRVPDPDKLPVITPSVEL